VRQNGWRVVLLYDRFTTVTYISFEFCRHRVLIATHIPPEIDGQPSTTSCPEIKFRHMNRLTTWPHLRQQVNIHRTGTANGWIGGRVPRVCVPIDGESEATKEVPAVRIGSFT
jgi:hypothetical protein